MPSEFLGLEIGKRGLIANQTALNTVSHNLSNASNKDYTRQEVNFQTVDPLYTPSLNREEMKGQIGQGMVVSSVMRVRDQFVDSRIIEENSNAEFYKTQHLFLGQIENVFSEPGQSTLKDKFDGFLQDWNDVALNPSDPSPRAALVSSSQAMVGMLHDHYQNLQDIRSHVNSLITDKVQEINNLSSEIKDLNVEIVKVKALKDEPNDLMDKRDALIDQLSKIADVKVMEKDPDEIFVYIGSQAIVQGVHTMPLQAVGNGEKDGMVDVKFSDGKDVHINNGELAALIKIRDKDLPDAMQKLNNFAVNLAKTVNSVHEKGFGLTRNTHIAFFSLDNITGSTRGNFDSKGNGQLDSTRLYSVTGTQSMKLTDTINENGVMNFGKDENGKNVLITYKSTETVRDVLDQINHSSAPVSAYLNNKGNIVFKALYTNDMKKGFSIQHLEDSGVFLTSFSGVLQQSGTNGAFDSGAIDQANKLVTNNFNVGIAENAAENLSVNAAILNDPANIAARQGKDTNGDGILDSPNGSGDGSNAFKIISSLSSTLESNNSLDPNVKLDNNAVMLDKDNPSFRPYLDTMIAKVGEDAKSAKMNSDKEDTVLTGLQNLKQSISGVNVDEELVQLIKFQHGYEGSAKIISTMNSMLDTLMALGR